MTTFETYAEAYTSITMERRDGILQLTLHTEDGPFVWGARGDGEVPTGTSVAHRELPQAFADVRDDPGNLCVILTGTGDTFIGGLGGDVLWERQLKNEDWYHVVREGTELLMSFLDIPVPVIAAVNGPCVFHSELAIAADIVLAAPAAVFQDVPHFASGIVPGDGIAQIWQHVIGPNRGRHFLLTGRRLTAEAAFRLGVVNEILPVSELLDRAWTLAGELTRRSTLTLRYTKLLLVAELRRLMREHLCDGLAREGAARVGGRPPRAAWE
jgi:enoyl-CoA hydratase/carnithine racemase